MSKKNKNNINNYKNIKNFETNTIKGVTPEGFNYVLDLNNLDNYEFIQVLGLIDKKPWLFDQLLEIVLGKEQKEDFINYLKNKSKNKVLKLSILQKELEAILENEKIKK